MIGALIGAGVGIASNILGGVKSAKAARQQKELLENERKTNEAWYNQNYYQDYLNRSDSQAAIKRVQDFIERRNKTAAASAAVTGATPEAVVAEQENNQQLLADTVGNIASHGDAYKDNVQARYQQQKNNLTNAQIGQLQADEQGGAQLAANGMQVAGSSVDSIANSAIKKATRTPTLNPTGLLPNGDIPQLDVEKPKFPNHFGE